MNAAAGEEPVQGAAEPDTPGEVLRCARERLQLSVQQAAEDLHLDRGMIEAIEDNRFAALGAPVYARGHLRNYAALLGVPAESVIARYETLHDTPVVSEPITSSVNVPIKVRRLSLKKPLLIALLLLALAAAVWGYDRWMRTGAALLGATTERVTASLNVTSPAGAPDLAAPQVAAERASLPSQQPTSAALESAAPLAASQQNVAADATQVRLRLEFTEPSWAEVYDGQGERLMFDLGAPGRVRALVGAPPLQVTLGAASAVKARVNDQAIVIPRRAGKDATKFVIDAAGAVQPASGR